MIRAALFLVVAMVAVPGLAQLGSADPPLPNFPLDFTTYEADVLVQFQGDFTMNGADFCCPIGSTCQVQTQYQAGTNYVAFTLNMTRFDGGGQIIVSDFNNNKEMLVVNGNCSSYCPLDEDLEPWNLEGLNATYNGTTTLNGEEVQVWTWDQTAFGVVVMQTSYFYNTVDQDNNVTPLLEIDYLTPFGQDVGQQNSTYSNWVPGTPSHSLFKVGNVKNCPHDSNCGNNNAVRQMSRIRNRLYQTWLRYQFQN